MCLCVTWGWIPVAMLYSSWALKPRQRRAGTSLIRAAVTAPDTQHSHSKDTPQPFLHNMQHNVKHGDIHRGRRRSRCSFAIPAEVFECRQRRKHHLSHSLRCCRAVGDWFRNAICVMRSVCFFSLDGEGRRKHRNGFREMAPLPTSRHFFLVSDTWSDPGTVWMNTGVCV